MNKKLQKFYAITDRKQYKKPLLYQIEEILRSKTQMIQIREKDLSSRELLYLCKQIKCIMKKYKNSCLIINERVDVAILCSADGVHLPENSFDIRDIKNKFPYLIVGKSCHNLECVKNVEKEGADYIVFSPIFYVPNKGEPKGLEKLREVVNEVKVPVYALGGINKNNIEKVFKTGVFGVAGIRLFLQ